METINIFKCIGNEIDIIPDKLLEKLKISYETANNRASEMAMLSELIKEENKKEYCRLPFCHTVEAEAFGSEVIFNQRVGNRIGKYRIEDMDSIGSIQQIDLNKGRISEVLKAVSILKKNGENVVLNIGGPISIATSVMDSQLFYKILRKDRHKIDSLLKLIENSAVEYISEGIKRSADIISFADPAGTIDIVGPKIYKELSGKATYNILKRIEKGLGKSVVHLCGKTSTSLEATGLLESEIIETEGKDYFQMIQNAKLKRKDIKFIGHWCLKTDRFRNQVVVCNIK
ncbi:methylcobamide--CoM methyltransferase [Acidilutibacter cellobiosedens]|uniref:Methylcobamide--CoM methyltransferase n=1 Tax=Acidilutibacter cellobiosedens TaxID=2507161 RepID=A0A410QFW3_9FIRM|nr:uroporphyrinogen decarboxylase family protein [Acidilutibacter cellobiosedens]QAT62891.1 methylcobamide--CoM methyltransferase [Acidilutibacter cellobiosedens]